MTSQTATAVVAAMLPGGMRSFPKTALHAWRGMTLRQWTWTTAIALLLLLANTVGVLPVLLRAVPTVIGRGHVANIPGMVGALVVFLMYAYCFLLAVRIAEYGAPRRQVKVRRYVMAGVGAWGTGILLELALYVLIPSSSPAMGGWQLLLDGQQLLGRVGWSAGNIGLSGGLVLAVYVRLRSSRLAREAFNAAELERVAASREVLASRLAAMQARVEPGFLLGTLSQVEALYDRDRQAGDHMLDGLIAYLHAALPQLRSQFSTVQQELELVESYLRIVQIRMGSRLHYDIDVGSGLGNCDFPPMVLLPLIDDALRNGLEPLPHGGTITITAHVKGDRLRLVMSDDGLPRVTVAKDGLLLAALRERLTGLYGSAATLELVANTPQGVLAVIEIPLDTTRADR